MHEIIIYTAPSTCLRRINDTEVEHHVKWYREVVQCEDGSWIYQD